MNSLTYFSIRNYKMHNIYTSIVSHTCFLQLLTGRGEVGRIQSAFLEGIWRQKHDRGFMKMSTLSEKKKVPKECCTNAVKPVFLQPLYQGWFVL